MPDPLQKRVNRFEVTDALGVDKATGEWWFTVSVGGKLAYEASGYANERAAMDDLVRYRAMAEAFVARELDELEREKTRPYAVLVLAENRGLAERLVPFLRWRLDLPTEVDAEFLCAAYGHRPSHGLVVDGVVYVHPAKAEAESAGVLQKSASCLRRGGWRAYLGGDQPWKNARDLLQTQ